jgi:hypothetical protein
MTGTFRRAAGSVGYAESARIHIMHRYRIEVAEADPGALVGNQAGFVFDVVPNRQAVIGDAADAALQLNDPYGRARYCTLTVEAGGELSVRCHSEGRGAWLLARSRAAGTAGLRASHLDASIVDPSARERWIRTPEDVTRSPADAFVQLVHPGRPCAQLARDGILLVAGVQLRIQRLEAAWTGKASSAQVGRPAVSPHDLSRRTAEPSGHALARAAPLPDVAGIEELLAHLGGAALRFQRGQLEQDCGELPPGEWLAPGPFAAGGATLLDELVGRLHRAVAGGAAELRLVLHRAPGGAVSAFSLLMSEELRGRSVVAVYPLLEGRGCLFGAVVWSRFSELVAASRWDRDSEPEPSMQLPPTGEGPRVHLVHRLQRFLDRHRERVTEAHFVASKLTLAPDEIPVELPSVVARAAADDGALAAEAYELLSSVRHSALRLTGRDRRLISACVEAQRSLAGGLARLFVESQGARHLERLLLLRAMLLRPPEPGEAAGAERWLAATLWHALGDDAGSAARVACHAEALLHDVIKHQPSAIDAPLDAMRAERALTPEQRRALDSWLEQLIERLTGLDGHFLAPRGLGGGGLVVEELEALTALRLEPSWSRLEALTLDTLVERSRRLLEALVARLTLSMVGVVERVVERRAEEARSLAAGRVEMVYDAGRRGSLSIVAPATALDVIVDNLVQNALFWAAAGRAPAAVRVTLGLAGDPRRPRLALGVEDSGPGLRPDAVEGVLASQGGLRHVQQQLHLLAGSLRVARSALGGAAFVVELPRNLLEGRA